MTVLSTMHGLGFTTLSGFLGVLIFIMVFRGKEGIIGEDAQQDVVRG